MGCVPIRKPSHPALESVPWSQSQSFMKYVIIQGDGMADLRGDARYADLLATLQENA